MKVQEVPPLEMEEDAVGLALMQQNASLQDKKPVSILSKWACITVNFTLGLWKLLPIARLATYLTVAIMVLILNTRAVVMGTINVMAVMAPNA